MKKNHLSIEKARQELTVLKSLIGVELVDKDFKESNEVAILQGVNKLINN